MADIPVALSVNVALPPVGKSDVLERAVVPKLSAQNYLSAKIP